MSPSLRATRSSVSPAHDDGTIGFILRSQLARTRSSETCSQPRSRPEVRMGVRTAPGQSALTRSPLAAASGRNEREMPTTACFMAE